MRILFAVLLAAGAYAADVAGKWNVTASSPSGREYKLELEIRNNDGKLTGSMTSSQGSVDLQDMQIKGDELTYKIPVGEGGYLIKLTVAGDSMKGSYTTPDGTTGPVAAVRAASAAAAPAGVTGKWRMIAKASTGKQYDVTLDIAASEGKLSGTLTAPEGAVPLTEPKLEGDQFSFRVVTDDGTYAIKATLAGGSMKGSYTGPNSETGTLEITR
ncbi:MAG: hypothetical protein ACE15B_08655 [Bryobacteraceae bacterium]